MTKKLLLECAAWLFFAAAPTFLFAQPCNPPILTNLPNQVFCAGSCFQNGPFSHCQSGFYADTLTSFMGCDSVVKYTLIKLDPSVSILPHEPLFEGGTLDLHSDGPAAGPAPSFVWKWKTPLATQIIGTNGGISINKGGDYYLICTQTKSGVVCSDTTFTTVYLIQNPVSAPPLACFPPNISIAEDCESACVFCSVVPYFEGSNKNSTASVVPNFCSTVENDVWFGFFANLETPTFELTATNCLNGNGLQFALFGDSCGADFLGCNIGCAGCADSVLTITATENLIFGKSYFLMVDGWAGDGCDFQIVQNNILIDCANPPAPNGPIHGPTTICPNGRATFWTTSKDTYAGYFRWTAPAGASINHSGLNDVILPANETGKSAAFIEFGSVTGAQQVSVKPFSSCNNGFTIAKTVQVQPIPMTILPPLTFCAEDNVDSINICGTFVNPTPGTTKTHICHYTTAQGCDSITRRTVTIRPILIKNLPPQVLCQGDSFQVGNQFFSDAGPQSVVLQSVNGCDSTVYFTLTFLDPIATILPHDPIPVGGSVVLQAGPQQSGPSPQRKWLLPNGQTVAGNSLSVSDFGQYCLVSTQIQAGKVCSDTTCETVFFKAAPILNSFVPGCSPPNTPPAEDCESACIYCNFINNYGGTTSNVTPSSVPQFCGSIEDDQWFGFVAGGPNMTFTVTPEAGSCQNGNGIQLALYQECGGPYLQCNVGCQGCGDIPQSITAGNLTIGKPYFLLVDGYAGDQCNFTIAVNPPSAFVPPPLVEPTPAIQGPTTICNLTEGIYWIPKLNGAAFYEWTGPSDSNINGSGTNHAILEASGSICQANILFGQESGLVTVTPRNSCNFGQTASIYVELGLPTTTILPDTIICFENLPFQPVWSPNFSITQAGTFLVKGSLKTASGCDSLIQQKVIAQPPTTQLPDLVLCNEQLPFQTDFGQILTTAGTYFLKKNIPLGGLCDSSVTQKITIAPFARISPLTLTLTDSKPTGVLHAINYDPATLVWTINGQSISTKDSVLASIPGEYCLIVNLLGCSDTACITVLSTVATKNPAAEEAFFSLQPNPADGFVTLQIHSLEARDDLQFSLWNTSGQSIFSEKMPPRQTHFDFKTDVLPDGIYLVGLRSEGRFLIQKLIVQH